MLVTTIVLIDNVSAVETGDTLEIYRSTLDDILNAKWKWMTIISRDVNVAEGWL